MKPFIKLEYVLRKKPQGPNNIYKTIIKKELEQK